MMKQWKPENLKQGGKLKLNRYQKSKEFLIIYQ